MHVCVTKQIQWFSGKLDLLAIGQKPLEEIPLALALVPVAEFLTVGWLGI